MSASSASVSRFWGQSQIDPVQNERRDADYGARLEPNGQYCFHFGGKLLIHMRTAVCPQARSMLTSNY